MSERMRPIPFNELLNWALTEYKNNGTMFGVSKIYKKDGGQTLSLFEETIETPFGPAAGPHTQLAQNIVAAYLAGSRFFELKTVQTLDGEDLPVAKPCISAADEGYNCEWSTELRVPQAMEEYVKAWFLLKLLSKEYNLGSPDGFIFNMSVGYDYDGITSDYIDNYIEGLRHADQLALWKEMTDAALAQLDAFDNIDEGYIRHISPEVSESITLSTLHGCPPTEIERIASYLINEKGLNTFVKCNPTMLGYETARGILDAMGYDYMEFDDFHFLHDLQYADAVPMITRLKEQAKAKDLAFGVKITNTFPQKVVDGVLPSEDMYMSGRSLFPVSIELASRLANEFDGDLRISYSGGADADNIADIFRTGIWPITVATTLLKPGGYNRAYQLAEALSDVNYKEALKLKPTAVRALADAALTNPHHLKGRVKAAPKRKLEKNVPLVDCFVAPCQAVCPISQDIPDYIELLGQGKPLEAITLITSKNPLPFITGTICNHRCMDKCTRNFYDTPVCIRDAKLESATLGFDELLAQVKPAEKRTDKKAAVIGGGPAGISAASFLARNGMDVTLYERKNRLGGVVDHIIPNFRIDQTQIGHDVALMEALGVKVELNADIKDVSALDGFDYVVAATGAWRPSPYHLEGDQAVNVLDFLEAANNETADLGKNVIVIGGGNTAMDAARAAVRVPGVDKVTLLYRRTIRYMPADEEELQLALEDGVEFRELLSPEVFENGVVKARKMQLGAPDESGRRSPEPTEEFEEFAADTVIAAVGQKIDADWFAHNGAAITKRGRVAVDPQTLQATSGLYVAGDAQRGPATVVEAIADARKAAEAVLAAAGLESVPDVENVTGNYENALKKRGILKGAGLAHKENTRCLECATVCESCTDVCPNRANIAIVVPGHKMRQIIHVERMCNECGNCETFCPYDSAPYKDKFTLFNTPADFDDSENEGFLILEDGVKIRLDGKEFTAQIDDGTLPEGINGIVKSVKENYGYLL